VFYWRFAMGRRSSDDGLGQPVTLVPFQPGVTPMGSIDQRRRGIHA
jgi:hypothetical protein